MSLAIYSVTEVLLSYAEACNALGEDGKARRTINLIRQRAGMPAISSVGNRCAMISAMKEWLC